jgi:hypothetical protein
MDRRLSVNAMDEFVPRGPLPGDPGESLPGLSRTPYHLPASMKTTVPNVQHPCLYIGTSGQRCDRPATNSDFCSRHSAASSGATDPDATPSDNTLVKRAVAVGGVIAVLWPLIVDLLRALLRFLR